jgi:hypothetical protein
MFLLVSGLVFLPALTQGEVLYLKDGSSIQGRLQKMVNDTLYFETSFGSSIRVPREKVSRLDFAESPMIPAPGAAVIPPESSVPGTVMVSFEKIQLTSKVSVNRGKNEQEILRANWIECAWYMGSDKVHSQIDSVTDKTIREGPETRYRNDMTPHDFKVAVPTGSYQCRLIIRNIVPEGYDGSFDGGPLEKRLLIENVKVLPAQTTQYRVGMKRKMKIGSPQLFVFE